MNLFKFFISRLDSIDIHLIIRHSSVLVLSILMIGLVFFATVFRNTDNVSAQPDTQNYKIYVASNTGINTVKTEDNSMGDLVSTGRGMSKVVASPDGERIYAISTNSRPVLQVIDTSLDKVVKTVNVDGLDQRSHYSSIAISPNGEYIYLGVSVSLASFFSGSSGVYVIRTSDYGLVTKIPITNAMDIVMSHDGGHAYILNGLQYNGLLYKVNIVNNSIEDKIFLGMRAGGIAVGPNDKYIYAVRAGVGDVLVVDMENKKVIKTVYTDNANAGTIAMSPDGKYAYIPEHSFGESREHLYVFRTSDNNLIKSIWLDKGGTPSDVVVTPDGRYVYVTSNRQTNDKNKIFVVDANSQSLAKTINVSGNGSRGTLGFFLAGMAIIPSTIPSTGSSSPPTPDPVGSGCVIDTLPAGIGHLGGSSNPELGPTCTGGDLTWDVNTDGQEHTITYTAKIDPNYCETHGSGPIGKNSVVLVDSSGNTIAGPTTDQTNQAPINITCPLNIKGDIGGGSLGGQIKVNGPSVIVSSGQVPNAIKGSGDIKSFDGYNLGSLSEQINQTSDNFTSLANNTGDQFDFTQYDLNPTNQPSGGVVTNSGDMYLDKSLNNSGVLINKTGDIQINAGFANSANGIAGIVALHGDIIINNTNGMNVQNVGLFAPNGKIIINNNNSLLNWSGFMVAQDIEVNQGSGSKGGIISWAGKLAQKPLPGFKNLLNAISVNEVAPE